MPSPTRSLFDQKLVDLDHDLMVAAAVVAQSIGAVAEALATADHDLALEVVVGHDELDPVIRACETSA